jgi:hypothetical protein
VKPILELVLVDPDLGSDAQGGQATERDQAANCAWRDAETAGDLLERQKRPMLDSSGHHYVVRLHPRGRERLKEIGFLRSRQ